MNFDMDQVLNTVRNAIQATKTARELVEQIVESKAVITGTATQEQVDEALTELKKEYDELHARVQNKLRGTI